MADLTKRPADPLASMNSLNLHVSCILFILVFIASTSASFPAFTPADILSLTKAQCVVAIVEPNLNRPEQTTETGSSESLLAIADVAFSSEPKIIVGTCDLEHFVWPAGKQLELDHDMREIKAILFPRIQEDRTCLQKPENHLVYPDPLEYTGLVSADSFVGFVNNHCNTFRNVGGILSTKGLHKEYLLENLFSVKDAPNSVTVSTLVERQSTKQSDHCFKDDVTGEDNCPELLLKDKSPLQYSDVPNCERIPVPKKEDFINNYLMRSKPVLITGGMKSWQAMMKWTHEFFRQQYGDKEVHIKLTPKGEYEGIEPADIWETHKTFKIPPAVLKQLPYPDLVVRPAGISMKFSEFLDLVQKISEGTFSNVSAYLEYTSLADYFPELKEDLTEMKFIKNVLKLQHLNIWLSDGNTLGKTHFDPYDNFLFQISGEKQVTLFEPHNDFLYEAHIPEAILSYNSSLKQFRRSTLLDSTSMVMTPVDVLKPHLERFPRFGMARPMSCTIKEGEVLFMPAFWWHEVQSRPSKSEHRNLAVNFWYEPFFVKEFPCPECRLDVNPKYNHLL